MFASVVGFFFVCRVCDSRILNIRPCILRLLPFCPGRSPCLFAFSSFFDEFLFIILGWKKDEWRPRRVFRSPTLLRPRERPGARQDKQQLHVNGPLLR